MKLGLNFISHQIFENKHENSLVIDDIMQSYNVGVLQSFQQRD